MDSYLPEDLSFSKVVGVGMNDEELKANPRLTDTLVQNLNDKVRRTSLLLLVVSQIPWIVSDTEFRGGGGEGGEGGGALRS